MNLQHLKYMTEVERTGSVTKAAANLFMGQPNLSKAIKEVENEIGITVFRRSAKGVYPTPDGERFLARAKAVLEEMGKLEALYKQDNAPGLFTFCVPTAGYVPELLAQLARTLPVNTECITAPFYLAAENVSEGICKIAAVRCPDECRDFFTALINEKNLRSEQLFSGSYRLTASLQSPIRKIKAPTPEALSGYICITSGEDNKNNEVTDKRIVLRNGADPFELLSQLPEAYMLAPAVSESRLKKYGLFQQETKWGGGFADHLVTPSGYKPDECTAAFADCLKKVINEQEK